MSVSASIFILILLAGAGFFFGRQRSLALVSGKLATLHSLPNQYGWYVGILMLLPGILVILLWIVFSGNIIDTMVIASLPDHAGPATEQARALLLNDIHNTAAGAPHSGSSEIYIQEAAQRYSRLKSQGVNIVSALVALFAVIGGLAGFRTIRPDLRARTHVERVILILLILSSVVAIFATLGIVLSLIVESARFFARVPLAEFFFGLQWSPQTALREDQVGSSGSFGAIPLFAGTLLISFIAMCVAVPLGLMSAIYMTQYSRKNVRKVVKPLLEILAGIPTVVYGFFAALTVAPFIRESGGLLGLDVASESALAAGLVMGIMIIPLMSSLSDDALTAVPEAMRDGSLALGATRSETIKQVLIPAALPGIVGAFLLSVSRAVGETMIVVMAAGLAANLTANPLEAVTTITAQIVALLTGDQEFDSAKTLSAFALGLALFGATLLLNMLALSIVRKYRESYE